MLLSLLEAFGKSARWDPVLLTVVVYPIANQFFLKDEKNGRIFLVDTGAEVSMVLATPADRDLTTLASLRAANFCVIHKDAVSTIWQTQGRGFPATLVMASVQR